MDKDRKKMGVEILTQNELMVQPQSKKVIG